MRLLLLICIIFPLVLQVGFYGEIRELIEATVELGFAVTRWLRAVWSLVSWKLPSLDTVVDWYTAWTNYPLVEVPDI